MFALIPQNGKRITTHQLMERVYSTNTEPFHARTAVAGMVRILSRKINQNREPFQIAKTDRNGPHAMEFWIEKKKA